MDNIRGNFSPEEVQTYFGILSGKLCERPLPCEEGGERICLPEEFMLMCAENNDDIIHFKHKVTRRYVFLAREGTREYHLQLPLLGRY